MQSLYIKLIFILLAVTSLFSSCEEIDEYPADISLILELNTELDDEEEEEEEEEEEDVYAFDDDDLSISEAIFSIAQIKVEAEMENGERIMFQENIEEEEIKLRNGESINLSDFNLPPAVYSYITIELQFVPGPDGSSLGIAGTVKGGNTPGNAPTPLLFQYGSTETVKLNVQNSNGAMNEIVVLKDDSKEINIKVDVGFWFQNIGEGQLIAANKIPLNGIETILVNSENNPDLYTSISTRIQQSFSAGF